MRLIGKKRLKSINISDSGAFSDLAFLLIIFFIVTAVFKVNQGFLLGLPKKGSVKLVNINEIIKVTLTENNYLNYNNKIISLDELENILKEKIREKPNTTFLLKISPDAKYQNVIDVLNVIKKLDIKNFSFSMIK